MTSLSWRRAAHASAGVTVWRWGLGLPPRRVEGERRARSLSKLLSETVSAEECGRCQLQARWGLNQSSILANGNTTADARHFGYVRLRATGCTAFVACERSCSVDRATRGHGFGTGDVRQARDVRGVPRRPISWSCGHGSGAVSGYCLCTCVGLCSRERLGVAAAGGWHGTRSRQSCTAVRRHSRTHTPAPRLRRPSAREPGDCISKAFGADTARKNLLLHRAGTERRRTHGIVGHSCTVRHTARAGRKQLYNRPSAQ